MSVALKNKLKSLKAYDLVCAIAVVGAVAKKLENGAEKIASERVLTLKPLEARHGLPDAVLDSPAIKRAIKAGSIQVLNVKKQEPKKTERAKPLAAPKKKEG